MKNIIMNFLYENKEKEFDWLMLLRYGFMIIGFLIVLNILIISSIILFRSFGSVLIYYLCCFFFIVLFLRIRKTFIQNKEIIKDKDSNESRN